MKKLIVISLICLFFSCKDDEPKTLILTNGINQTHIRFTGNLTYTERVRIYFCDDTKRIRTEIHEVLFHTVRNLTGGYHVTTTPVEDNITSIYVTVEFYSPEQNLITLEYQCGFIPLHDGLNEYTITEGNSEKWPSN